MSEARRTAEALEAARETVKTAALAASQHSHRGHRSSWPQHINDLSQLASALETIHYLIAQNLATVVKSCANDVRTHYFHGDNPDGKPWPESIKQAAANADQTLSKLCRQLEKTSASESHNALVILHGRIINLRHDKHPT
ncbi:hypothetical protein [Kibdelosporangium aridum]|uniref:hypothetical protein n=1 Tax=Kibdelosporangium aridum TaxID=2030 RepID=UPI000527BE12